MTYTERRDLPAIIVRAASAIDRLITIDISLRGVIDTLYRLATEKTDLPLSLAAARALVKSVQRGDVVFIATGWLDRPHISLKVAETDGPPGAVALARAVKRGLHAVPFLLVEEDLLTAMEVVTQAAGLKVLSPEEAMEAASSEAPIHAASVLSFPADLDRAANASAQLIQDYRPAAVVSVEKGGMNHEGNIYTSRGHDTTEYMAKIDLLMQRAKKAGITTIGIGDGGNEIGMGLIGEGIRRTLPFGDLIAPATKTDYLVTASVSNWGAYGVAACLAILLEKPEVFHDQLLERRVLHRCADAGLIDGVSGYVEESADGLPSQVHIALVTILAQLANRALAGLRKESSP